MKIEFHKGASAEPPSITTAHVVWGASRDDKIRLVERSGSNYLYVGTKSMKDMRAFQLKIRQIVRRAQEEEIKTLVLSFSQIIANGLFLTGFVARQLVENLYLANYNPDSLKTIFPESGRPGLERVVVEHTGEEHGCDEFDEGTVLGETMNDVTRHLSDLPSNYKLPSSFAARVDELCKGTKVKFENLGIPEGAGLLRAVGQGSVDPACMLQLTYMGGDPKDPPLVLIGKGVVHDTGGLNIKQGNGMLTMHRDMTGAAAVAGVVLALARLRVKRNVIGLLPVADNAISGAAYKPGDVYTSLSGHSVKIENTDAEGRLILADAITYAIKNLNPLFIICMATLTGASMVATGARYSALFAPNPKLKMLVHNLAALTGDPIWPLPLDESFNEELKSPEADIRNVTGGTHGGASFGAAFLQFFFRNSDSARSFDDAWMYLDIASVMEALKADGLVPGYSTGSPVRLGVELCRQLPDAVPAP